MKRLTVVLLVVAGAYARIDAVQAEQPSCKVCAEQRAACMKNYAGPACKTEYDMCVKACRK